MHEKDDNDEKDEKDEKDVKQKETFCVATELLCLRRSFVGRLSGSKFRRLSACLYANEARITVSTTDKSGPSLPRQGQQKGLVAQTVEKPSK